MPKKQVLIKTWSPIQYYNVEQGWVDVDIEYKIGPRKRVFWQPTLIGYQSFQHDLALANENHGKTISYNNYWENFGVKPFEPFVDDRSEEIAELSMIEKRLKSESIVICNNQNRTPDIYTNEEFITKKTAEKMLSHFMAYLGYKSVNFRWQKNKEKFYVQSTF